MMFKLSFKEISGQPYKRVFRGDEKGDKTTTVILNGHFKFPKQMSLLPQSIQNWMFNEGIPYISADGTVFISKMGIASRHPDDKDNPALGERIAEARAKVALYQFMKNLIYKILQQVSKFQYGRLSVLTTYRVDILPDADCLCNAFFKYEELIAREKEHLNELTA